MAAIVLLTLFVLSLPASLRRHATGLSAGNARHEPPRWPLAAALTTFGAAAVLAWIEGAALVAVYIVIATSFWWG